MEELFRKEALQIEYGSMDWQDAVRVTGKLLLDIGSVEEGYIQAMIDAVNDFGPYIVIIPHVALAHAAAETHVINNDVVLLVFKEPIIFNSENDPVHMIIGLCALKIDSHKEQLKKISKLLDDEDLIEKLLGCDSIEQVYEVVNR